MRKKHEKTKKKGKMGKPKRGNKKGLSGYQDPDNSRQRHCDSRILWAIFGRQLSRLCSDKQRNAIFVHEIDPWPFERKQISQSC